jgi:hypothetical protein
MDSAGLASFQRGVSADGEKAQMRNPRIIIPVIVFLVSALISGGRAIAYRNSVNRVLTAAQRNGYPIVVATSMRNDYRLAAYTIGEPGALLVTESASIKLGLYFDDSGVLHYLMPNPLIDQSIEFPNYRPTARFRGECVALRQSGYYHASNVNHGRYRYQTLSPVSNNIAEVYIADMSNCMARQYAVNLGSQFGTVNWSLARDVWTNGSSVYLLMDRFNETTSTSPSMVLPISDLWKYNVDTMSWTRIFDGTDEPYMDYACYGSDGLRIAIASIETPVTYFIDAESGERIHTIENESNPAIGRRWAVCTGYTEDDHQAIFLYDMHNDWERYVIELPYYGYRAYYSINWAIALYEPESTLHPDD